MKILDDKVIEDTITGGAVEVDIPLDSAGVRILNGILPDKSPVTFV